MIAPQTSVPRRWRRLHFKAMGGPCEIRALCASDAALQPAVDEIRRLETKYSRFREDSVTTRINRAAGRTPVLLDAETRLLLRYAHDAWQVSDGLFDITSGVLRAAWDFKSGRVPDSGEVERLLSRIGWQRVRFDAREIALQAGMEIDFGGIVKEYAADRVVRVLKQCGVEHALVELAGDIAVTGPLPDGSPWLVRIRHPRDASADAGALELFHGGIATSGDYERCIVVNGRRYSHLLDPRTGWPVTGLASVTVAHASCTVAGTLATIAMLKGSAGEKWLRDQDVVAVCLPS